MKKIIFLLFLLSSCQACKDKPIIDIYEPESTDIFRCKVNGVDWEPDAPTTQTSSELDVYYEDVFLNSIRFNAQRKIDDFKKQFMSITINVENNILGEHPIINNTLFTDYINDCGFCKRDTNYVNLINITNIDTINYILTGNFEFKCINDDCIDETFVQDGYFKVKYRN